jgi:NAD(P)-dependent dehydrogenase (short-subunit alcohol dehydrogenase family)
MAEIELGRNRGKNRTRRRQSGETTDETPIDSDTDAGPEAEDADLDAMESEEEEAQVEEAEYYEDFVLITGVSSGIGYATARELLDADYRVLGSVRTQEDAARLAEEFGDGFYPLIFDVTDEDAVRAAADQTREIVGDNGLYGLVNNAGIAVGGPLQHLPLVDFRRPFEVNVFGMLTVTQAFLPLLGADHSSSLPAGRVVNISSISGYTVYPFVGPYAASKYALEAVSDGLRRELLLYGIPVILIVPGSVNTSIWQKAGAHDFERFADTDYAPALEEIRANVEKAGQHGMPVARVSRTVRLALEAEKPKTRYVLANSWWFGWFLPRWLPAEWMDRALARQMTS